MSFVSSIVGLHRVSRTNTKRGVQRMFAFLCQYHFSAASWNEDILEHHDFWGSHVHV